MINLYSYQQEALNFCENKRNVYISLPPGGGKTLTALEATKEFLPVLIICPASLTQLWKDEITKWYGEKSIQILGHAKMRVSANAEYIIVSYNKALKIEVYKQLMAIPFKALILDEAHALKNPIAKRTEAILGWRSQKARLATKKSLKKVILLSGTPMMQRPIELYSTLRGLHSESMGRYKIYENFGVRFAQGRKDGFGKWIFSGSSHLDELARMSKDFLFRVPREVIEAELPELRQQIIRLDCGRKIIEQMQVYGLEALVRQGSTLHDIAFEGLAELRHQLALEKVPLIIDYINNLRESGENIIIFAWHRSVINSLMESFPDSSRIDGSVPTNSRVDITKEFNSKTGQIAICQVKAASEGLSFHTATHVIFAEVSWNPAENEQAYKRAHRRGQKSSVLVHYMVANQSLDDHIMKQVLTKQKNVDIFYNELITGEN